MRQLLVWCGVMMLAVSGAAAREMTSVYVVTQAANTTGQNSTDWHTDLTLYNPHAYPLPVVLQYLQSGRDNSAGVPTLEFDVEPWETLNLWDILGTHGFDRRGTNGSLLVLADDELIQCAGYDCDFAVFARTYTISNRWNLPGEFGQAAPGYPAHLGLDWDVIGFLPQLMDNNDFRTNLGVASLTPETVRVRIDLQDSAGNVVAFWEYTFPPFSVAQWRLPRSITGGTAAVYIIDGPASAVVFPYASVINNESGDAVTIEPHYTIFQGDAQAAGAARVDARRDRLSGPPRLRVDGFALDLLRRPPDHR